MRPSLARPSDGAVRAFLESQRDRSFSYAAVGASAHVPPAGFRVDHNRTLLGTGAASFARAKAALASWRMFDLGWVVALPDGAAIAPGTTVAVRVRWASVWFLNAARVVYAIDEPRRFGFAYGTLPAHAESGEERFSAEWDEEDRVWYDLFAFSRPRALLARIGYPFSRGLQVRFARESLAAMRAACREGAG